jgi:hypothetical protein
VRVARARVRDRARVCARARSRPGRTARDRRRRTPCAHIASRRRDDDDDGPRADVADGRDGARKTRDATDANADDDGDDDDGDDDAKDDAMGGVWGDRDFDVFDDVYGSERRAGMPRTKRNARVRR